MYTKIKIQDNFLTISYHYNGDIGYTKAFGIDTMLGQSEKENRQKAISLAKNKRKELENKYNLEDIYIEDLGNGVIQLFAVSDDFLNLIEIKTNR